MNVHSAQAQANAQVLDIGRWPCQQLNQGMLKMDAVEAVALLCSSLIQLSCMLYSSCKAMLVMGIICSPCTLTRGLTLST